jgi:type II secretory pathway pseudopilin PulG
LVIVLSVTAVVAAVTVPRYASASARYKADFAAKRIVADLELAAATARNASASRTVSFGDDDTYTIDQTGDLNRGSATTYRVRLAEAPYGATRVKADFGGDAVVVFDGYGAPDTGGVVVVEVGSVTKTVTVDPNGKASVQ